MCISNNKYFMPHLAVIFCISHTGEHSSTFVLLLEDTYTVHTERETEHTLRQWLLYRSSSCKWFPIPTAAPHFSHLKWRADNTWFSVVKQVRVFGRVSLHRGRSKARLQRRTRHVRRTLISWQSMTSTHAGHLQPNTTSHVSISISISIHCVPQYDTRVISNILYSCKSIAMKFSVWHPDDLSY